MSRRPLICAHRGASAAYPENTMTAFTAAVEMGADMIETDIRRDRLGRLVVNHDPLSDAHPDPHHLEHLVEFAAGRVALDVELKEAGYEEQVLELLLPRPSGLLVTSFLPQAVAAIRTLDPTVETGLIIPSGFIGDPLRAAALCGAQVLVLHSTVMELAVRRRAAAHGVGVLVWTVNDPDDLRPLMADETLLGVITDVPDLAAGLRAA